MSDERDRQTASTDRKTGSRACTPDAGRSPGGGSDRRFPDATAATALTVLLVGAAVAANILVPAPSLERALFFLPVLIPVFYQQSTRGALVVSLGGVLAAFASELAVGFWGGRAFDPSLVSAVTLILVTCAIGSVVLHRRIAEETRSVLVDPTTGLPGPEMVDLVLHKNVAAARRGQSLTVAMVQMDGLEDHDERCGCNGGRPAHRNRVAEVLRTSVRDMDFVGRFDEESFLAVILHESSNGVSVLADRLRSRVEELDAVEEPRCTVSVGIVAFGPETSGPRDLLRRVRETVDRAQKLGGNQVLLARRDGFRQGPRSPTFPAHLRVL